LGKKLTYEAAFSDSSLVRSVHRDSAAFNECVALYASVEASVAELYVWHRVLEW